MRLSSAVFAVSLCGVALAQEAQQPPLLKGGTQEVLLDLIVRDKKERFIRDLKAEDVQVIEDGTPQTVKAFRLVDGSESGLALEKARKQAAPGDKTQALRELNVVSLIFEQMSPRSRLYAKEAAEEFLKNELGPHTYVGIFSLDFRLNALENYTTNRDKLIAAIGRASTGNYSDFRHQSDLVLNNTRITIGMAGSAPSGPGQGSATMTVAVQGGAQAFNSPSAAVGGAEAAPYNSEAAMALAMIQQKQLEMVASGVGWRSLEGLLSVLRAQSSLPGRKTVILLSEGLMVPPQADDIFRGIISTANRSNISVYTIDVTGLSTTSAARGGIDRMHGVAQISSTQIKNETANNSSNTAPTEGAERANQDDKLQLAVLGDTQARLRELAEDTGGFMIANTNDFRRPLNRIMEDVRSHYEVSYSPTSNNYDGHFRKIEVKLRRSGTHVQSRQGYYALPMLKGEGLQPYEMACLKALESNPPKSDFGLRVNALRFEPGPGPIQHEIVFEVPSKEITFTEVTNTGNLRAHLSFLAVIKDDKGQIVEKLSHDMPAEFTPDRKAAARQGNFIFHQVFRLAPGRYTIEAAAVDGESDESSVKRSILIVPDGAAPSLSNLVLVRNFEPLEGERNDNDPLQTTHGRVLPALDNRAPAGTEVPVYFVLYPEKGDAKPQVTVELLQSGKLITTKTPDLPEVEPDGGMRFFTTVTPDPGAYELRVRARQGGKVSSQTLPLIVGMS